MRGVQALLLLFGLSTVRLEKSIIDRLVANQATNSEQKIVLESVATILSWSPTQYYKYGLVKIIGKNLRNPTNIGGNVSEKAIDNIREVFKNSENPNNVLEFLEICMDYLKKSNENEVLKVNFIDRCVEKLEGNLNFENIKTLIETGHWILPTETSDYLGIQILQAPPPIIDRMIENEATLMEKRLILFELKTIVNFVVKSSSYKWSLYTIIRKNNKYGNPDSVGGPISMQAVRNIQNALQMSENPKAFLEFLDICMDFLKSPATSDSPKLIFLHEAVTIIDKGYGMEDVKKSLMDEPTNVFESIFEALGIPERKDTTPNDCAMNLTTTESSYMETTTPSLPDAWDQFINKMENYIEEHPILKSEFLKLFEVPTNNVTRYLLLLYEFAEPPVDRDSIHNKLSQLRRFRDYADKPEQDFLKILAGGYQLDLNYLIDFFHLSQFLYGSEAADLYKEIWFNTNFFENKQLDLVIRNLKKIKATPIPFTETEADVIIFLIDVCWELDEDMHYRFQSLMQNKQCHDGLYENIPKMELEIQHVMEYFDATFGGHSCYHSGFKQYKKDHNIP
ncbi:hypothetical protein B9Z55_003413 [Caenorhabditis nigoni]|uniref:Pre-mRNA-splicing factor SPF27 n=1 Tax=Caenorhabditis nigoni TaxID=1611254 RepID=A0A2G5VQV9_9PELO|nr:hypothetical protein B9Z55_003413 [Caenorhabditis nigoni]